MTKCVLLVSLAAGSLTAGPLTAPAPALSAATEFPLTPALRPATAPVTAPATRPAIRAITVRPADPVVGAHGSVRLVIDVVAKGVRGKDGVTVKVEPGTPPGPLLAGKPPVLTEPAHPAAPPSPAASPPAPAPAQPPSHSPAQPPAQSPAQPPVEPLQSPAQSPAQPAVEPRAQQPTQPSAASPALPPATGFTQPVEQSPTTAPKDGVTLRGDVTLPDTVIGPGALTPRNAPQDAHQNAPQHARPQAQPELPPRLVWRLAAKPVARMADGWETWRFLPDKRLNRFYSAGAWTVSATAKGAGGTSVTEYAKFDLKRETRLTSVTVDKTARSGVRVRGSLTRVDPRGLSDFGPYAKQSLELLWRPDSTAAWAKVGEASTDAAGAFVGTVTGRTGGFWRVRFPGTGHYSADHSKSRQIAQ